MYFDEASLGFRLVLRPVTDLTHPGRRTGIIEICIGCINLAWAISHYGVNGADWVFSQDLLLTLLVSRGVQGSPADHGQFVSVQSYFSG